MDFRTRPVWCRVAVDYQAAGAGAPTVRHGPHFSLLTGLAGHHVALADPSQGRLIWTPEDFLRARATAVRAICSRSEKILSGEW